MIYSLITSKKRYHMIRIDVWVESELISVEFRSLTIQSVDDEGLLSWKYTLILVKCEKARQEMMNVDGKKRKTSSSLYSIEQWLNRDFLGLILFVILTSDNKKFDEFLISRVFLPVPSFLFFCSFHCRNFPLYCI